MNTVAKVITSTVAGLMVSALSLLSVTASTSESAGPTRVDYEAALRVCEDAPQSAWKMKVCIMQMERVLKAGDTRADLVLAQLYLSDAKREDNMSRGIKHLERAVQRKNAQSSAAASFLAALHVSNHEYQQAVDALQDAFDQRPTATASDTAVGLPNYLAYWVFSSLLDEDAIRLKNKKVRRLALLNCAAVRGADRETWTDLQREPQFRVLLAEAEDVNENSSANFRAEAQKLQLQLCADESVNSSEISRWLNEIQNTL